jgi:hypothetical protein
MRLVTDNFGDVWFVSSAWRKFRMPDTLYSSQPRSICPIWHGMLCSVTRRVGDPNGIQVKITADMTGYAPAGKTGSLSRQQSDTSRSPGYVTDNTQFIRGFSPLHDSGTGSSLGLTVTQASRVDPHVI